MRAAPFGVSATLKISRAVVIEWFAIPGAVACYRTCALYDRNRRAVLGIVGLYLSTLVAGILIVALTVHNGKGMCILSYKAELPCLTVVLASAQIDPSVGLRICHSISPDSGLYTALYVRSHRNTSLSLTADSAFRPSYMTAPSAQRQCIRS